MRRAVAIIIVFGILGAIMNVAVAWGFASRTPESEWRRRIPWDYGYVGARGESWVVLMHQGWGRAYIERFEPHWNWLYPEEEVQAPHWSAAREPFAQPTEPRYNPWGSGHAEVAFGWPLMTVLYEYDYRVTYSMFDTLYSLDNLRDGIVLSETPVPTQKRNWRRDLHVLPYGVILPGFAINTLFYGTSCGSSSSHRSNYAA